MWWQVYTLWNGSRSGTKEQVGCSNISSPFLGKVEYSQHAGAMSKEYLRAGSSKAKTGWEDTEEATITKLKSSWRSHGAKIKGYEP